jgi:hypothetical protein
MRVGEQRAQRAADRHAARDLAITPMSSRSASNSPPLIAPLSSWRHVARRSLGDPGQAVAGAKAEAPHRDARALVALVGVDAARDLLELERLDALVETECNRTQGGHRGRRRSAGRPSDRTSRAARHHPRSARRAG